MGGNFWGMRSTANVPLALCEERFCQPRKYCNYSELLRFPVKQVLLFTIQIRFQVRVYLISILAIKDSRFNIEDAFILVRPLSLS